MRKALTVAIVASSLAAGGTTLAVAAPGGKDKEKAHGNVDSETTGGFMADTKFNAEDGGPKGPKGKVHRRVYDPATGETVRDFEGEVTCYSQTGNVARFSGRITKRKGDDPIPGDFFFFAVQDNGKGKKDPPDKFGAGRFLNAPDCTQPLVNPILDVTKGDVHVHRDGDDED